MIVPKNYALNFVTPNLCIELVTKWTENLKSIVRHLHVHKIRPFLKKAHAHVITCYSGNTCRNSENDIMQKLKWNTLRDEALRSSIKI